VCLGLMTESELGLIRLRWMGYDQLEEPFSRSPDVSPVAFMTCTDPFTPARAQMCKEKVADFKRLSLPA